MPCNSCNQPKPCNMPPACLALAQKCDPVLFHKVLFPAAAGNDVTNPPSTLHYKNVLLEYEANGHLYLYSSDGIPTRLPSELNTDDLMNTVEELKAQLQDETEARTQADVRLTENIGKLQQAVNANAMAVDAEETARKEVDTAINNTISQMNTSLSNSIAEEEVARKSADSALDASIVKTAEMLQTNINMEVNARESDRDNLQTNINTEVTNRIAADQELEKKIEGMGTEALDKEIEERKAADYGLMSELNEEKTARADADTNLQDQITTNTTDIKTNQNNIEAINNDLDTYVVSDLSVVANSSTVTLQKNRQKLTAPEGLPTEMVLPVASDTQAGVMNSATYNAVQTNAQNVDAILNGAVAISGISSTPSQDDLTTAWETATGRDVLVNRASIYDMDNERVWYYYENINEWKASANTGVEVEVSAFTNTTAGIIKGSENAGQLFAEADGTGSVNGWDGMIHDIENLSELVHSQVIPKLYTTETEASDGAYTAAYLNPTITKVSELANIQQIGAGLNLAAGELSAVTEGTLTSEEFNNEWENA